MSGQPVSRPLRIAQIAPLWTRVPPATYGGSELIVHLLTEELARRGHDVTLFATGDSQTSARLRAVVPRSIIEAMERGEAHGYEHYANASFAEALRESGTFDVIHCHLGSAWIPLSVVSQCAVVHTMHIGALTDDMWALERYPEIAVMGVSSYQTEAFRTERRPRVPVIHHGIDFDAYDFSPEPGKYLAFLGRMGSQKSPLHAIRIAEKCGMPLVLAGRPQNGGEERHFATHIAPLIDGKAIIHIGRVDHAAKNELLKNAAALVFPIQGEEAFGIAMIEAMACGTPVIGWNRASVPEVVDAGITGFVGSSVEALAEAVPAALALDRNTVREHARQRFSHRRMADDYVELYRELMSQR